MVDGVYEVMLVFDGKLVDFEGYVKCLEWLLSELEMVCFVIMDELL